MFVPELVALFGIEDKLDIEGHLFFKNEIIILGVRELFQILDVLMIQFIMNVQNSLFI